MEWRPTAQIDVVERRLEHALAGTGGTVVVHGEAGSGRTWFCERVAQLVRARSGTALADRAATWSVTMGRGPRADTTGWLEAAAATRFDRPHLFVVDDADRLDPVALADVRTLADTARNRHVVVVVTARRPGRLVLDPRDHEWVELTPLDVRTLTELIMSETGGEPSDVTTRRIAALSAGNARTAVEIARALAPAQLRSGEGIDELLLHQLAYTRALATEMRELPEPTRATLCTAAFARHEPSELVVRCLEQLGLTVDDLAPAEDAHWIVIDNGGIIFEHPLHHVAATSIVAFGRRREVIAAIADTVAQTDPLRSTWYEALDAETGDSDVVARLDELARRSAETGDPSFAVDVWRRAASLSPTCPSALLVHAARAAQIAGRLDDAMDLAASALMTDPSPRDRVDARRIEGLVMTWRGRSGDAWVRMAADAERFTDDRPFEAAGLFLQATIAAYRSGELAVASHLSQRAADMAHHLGPLASAAHAAAGYGRAMLGDPTGLDPIRAATDLHLQAEPFVDAVPAVLHLTSWVGRMLDETGEADAAMTMLDWTIERALATGATGMALMPRLHRAAAQLRRGDLDGATDDSAAMMALALEIGQVEFVRSAELIAGRIGALRGTPGAIDELNAIGVQGSGPGRFEALVALGQAALSVNDLGTAVRALSEASHIAEESGLAHPGHLPYESDLVEALVRCGETDRATQRAQQQAAVASTWPDPLVRGLAERSLGLVADDPASETQHFDRSLQFLDEARSPIEWARTELCRGERLRRSRRRAAAHEPLQRAATALRSVGARPWLTLVEAELRAAGAHDPHGNGTEVSTAAHDLTLRERDIARSVAEGHTNREVAAALHLSPKTVENHLSRIYAKLGVRSRTELAHFMHELDQRHPVEPTPRQR